MRWTSPHDLLVGGDVDLIERKPSSLWSNRLVLPGIDVIDHMKFDSEDKIAALPETFSLRGRHLEGAVLIGAGLRKVDLTAAYLSNAYLARADLRGAKFGCTTARLKVSNETPNDDNVPSEDSKETKKCAHLQNASLHLAKLPGAQLDRAELQGASLSGAHLEGATFTGAQLQGANLEFAELEGASLDHAELQGASLGRARLQGASLDYAELSGASLESAQMAGASLRGTDLQGAVLGSADFGGAHLKRVHVWRIDPLESSESSGLFFNAFVEDPQVKPDEWSVQSRAETVD